MRVSLVGLVVTGLPPPSERKIRVKVDNSPVFKTLNYPFNKPWNRGQIKKWICEHYGIEDSSLIWPDYIRVPTL